MKMDPDVIIDSETICAWFTIGERTPLRQATLRQWVSRGKLTVRGTTNTPKGRLNLYRYGDVAALLATRRKPVVVDIRDTTTDAL